MCIMNVRLSIFLNRVDRPTKEEKIDMARCIVTSFPILKDNTTANGFVCYYL